jgi:hypothetical protein
MPHIALVSTGPVHTHKPIYNHTETLETKLLLGTKASIGKRPSHIIYPRRSTEVKVVRILQTKKERVVSSLLQ